MQSYYQDTVANIIEMEKRTWFKRGANQRFASLANHKEIVSHKGEAELRLTCDATQKNYCKLADRKKCKNEAKLKKSQLNYQDFLWNDVFFPRKLVKKHNERCL